MTTYLNTYYCGRCGIEWTDKWDCQCDDECPNCGVDYSPYKSEIIEEDGDEQ